MDILGEDGPSVTSWPLHSIPNQFLIRYKSRWAAVVVEDSTVTFFVAEASTMLVIGLILSMFGIGLFCWLIFTLAVYALPFFVGLTVGMAAFHSGAGVLGALLVGVVTGAVTLAVGQIAFAAVRPPVVRAVIAAAFAIPAEIAGYHAVLGLSQIGVPSLVWREVFAWIGAFFIAGTASARMTVFAEPLPLRRSGAS
jgi:intracellular septation protein A